MSALALRLDDVGAASKRHEVYGLTRITIGPVALPFPGNFLFLKYLPPIKRWGRYRELSAAEWEAILNSLEGAGSSMTVGLTAGWVEPDGRVVPFPRKFPDQARLLREAVARGFLEIANHGYTHCVLQDRLFQPRLFSGNRQYHREFHEWLPEAIHRDHLTRAQEILQGFFACPVVTFIPPGNVFTKKTVAAAAEVGIRYLSCRDAPPWGSVEGVTFVDEAHVVSIHDRDVVLGGLDSFRRLVAGGKGTPFVTVREIGERMAARGCG